MFINLLLELGSGTMRMFTPPDAIIRRQRICMQSEKSSLNPEQAPSLVPNSNYIQIFACLMTLIPVKLSCLSLPSMS